VGDGPTHSCDGVLNVLSGLRWSEEGGDQDLALGGFGHICEIWSYHGFVAENISRMECEAELLGKYVSKDPSFSGSNCPASLSYISGFSKSSEFCDQLYVR
jgi:hypothetical protein